jgi:hypothetical protein
MTGEAVTLNYAPDFSELVSGTISAQNAKVLDAMAGGEGQTAKLAHQDCMHSAGT